MKVLCLVAIIMVVAQAALDNNQASLQAIGKESDSKSDIQIMDNLMGNEDMELQQFIPSENEAEPQKHQKMFLNQMDNEWKNRKNSQKTQKGYYPIDVDYSQDDLHLKSLIPMSDRSMHCKNSTSKLPTAIKDLMCLIFDIGGMKRTMMEFGIDLIKMPLEKLSKNNIMKAYNILTELETVLSNEVAVDHIQIVDASNRFYTIIPHNIGIQTPPLLNNIKFVKTKTDMLNNLLEIEFTYSIIKESDRNPDRDMIDYYYTKLKTQINVLKNDSNEYSVISKYITNNHDIRYFNISIMHIFKIVRQGEEKRYKPFKQMPNRQLLWHGSRVGNFAGILSKGLRIALAANGIFGRGIYFADLFDMSVGYTGLLSNSSGLLLLSEVALGEMFELTTSREIKKLPKGKHSAKGVGRYQPDPKHSFIQPDGVKVPYGLRVPSNFHRSNLYDNMYILYNETQINQKYLVQFHFTYDALEVKV